MARGGPPFQTSRPTQKAGRGTWPQALLAWSRHTSRSVGWTWISSPGRVFLPGREAHSFLRTWAFEQLGRCGGGFPSLGTRVLGVWRRGSAFPRGGVLSHEGVCFPMCRVRFFFAALDTCWLPQRISAGICSPESCSLMPSPTSSLLPPPGDPGSVVFSNSDPWPPDDTGWCLGSSE